MCAARRCSASSAPVGSATTSSRRPVSSTTTTWAEMKNRQEIQRLTSWVRARAEFVIPLITPETWIVSAQVVLQDITALLVLIILTVVATDTLTGLVRRRLLEGQEA